ncbi:hypothetical protein RO21_09660 [[Actinobacillus] muris]|uniref:DUF2628 domain-containing protein n=1 Tax=Muribacter muris TaxID=67855 RepID=A0A0J5P5T8_9PAST|nr:DUF2628 domain-containing protein [Muribacter muris]KMK50839.1 hypothetical protein RO21_09660 [[Actinobacillus] muris] [Muribacter muris]
MSEHNSTQYEGLKPKWQKRFAFFDKYGTKESAPEYKQAFKSLSFFEKRWQELNFIALFFGFIYFFVLGLWRKNLSIIGLYLVVGIIVSIIIAILNVPDRTVDAIANAIGLLFAFIYAKTANKAYYLHKVKGSKSWNPFES